MRKFIILLLVFISFSAAGQNYHYVLGKKSKETISSDSTSTKSTYTISQKGATSAGIYSDDGNLIRRLWSNVVKDVGEYELPEWDGKDDEGNTTPDGNYIFKILSSQVKTEWEGARIGNTSTNLTGEQRHKVLISMQKMISVGNKGYYAGGYNEQKTAMFTFDLNNPQVVNQVLDKGNSVIQLATDGTHIFWGTYGKSSFTNGVNNINTSYVVVTNVSDDTEYLYSNAQTIYNQHCPTPRNSAIAIDQTQLPNGDRIVITGLAVSGDFLFVCRQQLNQIDVYNLSTGANQVQSLTYTEPREIKADGAGNVWFISGDREAGTVSKYPVNTDGTLGTSTLTLSGLEDPISIGLKGTTDIAVADGGSYQNYRFFNQSTGVEGTALGQQGGYNNSPAAANDKFYMTDLKERKFINGLVRPVYNHASIEFDDAGNIWALCPRSNRLMKYDSNFNYLTNIQYIPDWLGTNVDKNDPTRVFVMWLEFEIDYTQPIESCWTLKNIWGSDVPSGYDALFNKFDQVVTLSNGRTYAKLRNESTGDRAVVELTSKGIRFTGVSIHPNALIAPNGDLWEETDLAYNVGDTFEWYKRALKGFDSNNNPVWGASTLIGSTKVGINDPLLTPGSKNNMHVTDEGYIYSFMSRHIYQQNETTEILGRGYHFGLYDPVNNVWKFRQSKATDPDYTGPYPQDGRFNINEVLNAGNELMILGDFEVWGYHGEFYKNQGQVNQYAMYHKGLLIDVFGTNFTENPNGTNGVERNFAFEGMAGNAFNPELVPHPTDPNIMYLYHGDESWHGAVHRWKISALNTVETQEISFTSN